MKARSFSATTRRTTTARWGTQQLVELADGSDVVPALFQLPDRPGPLPAVLLLHGLSSEKERMAEAVGKALAMRGVASLALDLPMHGERAKDSPRNAFSNPLALVGAWRAAVAEAERAVSWLGEQPRVDAGRLGIVGYSLGGFLALMAAADDPRLRVIAMAAAGDLPDATPYAAVVRTIVDPLRAVRRLAGRPLLLLNGRRDTTTRPSQAERLFAAARDPRTLEWYDGGHWPPPAAISFAADWMVSRLEEIPVSPTMQATG
jgi:uncharacterized protein